MAQRLIALGTPPAGMDGDDARTAFDKVNLNFTELYQGVVGDAQGRSALALGAAATFDVTTSVTDQTANRLLKKGDFGLGGVVPSEPDGTWLGTRFKQWAGSALDRPPTNAITVGLDTGYAENRRVQLAVEIADATSRAFVRGVTTPATSQNFWRELQIVGDKGIGGQTPMISTLSALNALDSNTQGNYSISSTVAAAASVPGGRTGVVRHYGRDGDMRVQVYTSTGYSDVITAVRTYNQVSLGWSPWQNMTPVGVGQNWGPNLASSRSYDTTYTNNTGRTMFVHVFVGATVGAQVGLSVITGGVSVIGNYAATAGSYVSVGPVPIAPGATYVVSQRNGTAPVNIWSEFS